jgi:hypothetical protein
MKMKTILLVLSLLCSAAASAQFYQAGGGSRDATPVIYEPPSHPQHADYAPMMQEHSVISGSYSSAQGERPASDFPQAPGISLGDYARQLKQQHEVLKKSRVVWVNQ